MTSGPPDSGDPDGTDAPHLTVALPEGDLRRRLLAALERTDVVVERLQRPASTRDALEDAGGDVIVIRRTQLPEDGLRLLRETARDEDAPDIVIVSEGESGAERASLLAAGATQVIDARQSPEDLVVAFEALVKSVSGESNGVDPSTDPTLADFLSRSPYMRRFLDLVRRVAAADSSLLITGETGVGKEHLARAIHAESPRADGPFVAVNCAALPESLIESELFGHVKGAFTGADEDRTGHFEAADGGTIFLDEIGETPPHVQVKLLNVLQRREVLPLGASKPTPIDVRVMAATNRLVEEDVRTGKFREDLFYRLNVVPLEIPPLRARPEDVPDLVGYLLRHFGRTLVGQRADRVTPAAMEALMAYSWPGNVRELINVVERAMLLADGHEIDVDALPPVVVGALAASVGALPSPGAHEETAPEPRGDDLPANWRELSIKEVRQLAIARTERAYLDALLSETAGVVAETAKRAGITPRALYDRMRRFGLDKDDYRR